MELFASQKSMLESLLADKETRAKAAPAEDYFTLFERGQRQQVLDFVLRARPQEIEECVDIRGFTLLHIAVRALDVDLTHAVLDKCEQLANSATTLLRAPLGFTPLMNPWINFRNCYPIYPHFSIFFAFVGNLRKRFISLSARVLADLNHRITVGNEGQFRMIAAALTARMTQSSLNARSGSWSTATHFAISHGNWPVLKRILWRLYELGGKDACVSHLAMTNHNVARFMIFMSCIYLLIF